MDKDNNQFFDDTSNSTLEKLKKLSSFNSHDEDEDEHTNNDKSDKLLNKMIKSSSIKPKKEESYLERLNRKVANLGLDGDDFDDIIDSIDIDDEDLELKSSLISMGRKYARANAVTEEEGEIEKAFAPQEQKLKDLYNEVSKDTAKIEHDLEMLRGNGYNKNVIKTAELASAKTSLHTTKLSIIKELNAMKKAQFEIKAKNAKNASDDAGENYVSSEMIQRIFGMGHDSILSSVGGRDSAAGDSSEIYNYGDESAAYINESPEDIAGEKMCDEYSNKYQATEGDIYLKYEGQNINVVVEEHNDGSKEVYAEDEDGNKVPDYPIPRDVDELTFEINERTGTAIDQLQRKYVYRSSK